MRQISKIWILLALISISSCSGNKKNTAQDIAPKVSRAELSNDSCKQQENMTISINIKEAITLNDFNRPKYNITLDESAENIIGFPTNVVVRNDTIFAIDGYKSPGIYAYNKKGKQLFAYCSIGNGPEDIMSPKDLNVTETEISCFDRGSGDIVFFDKNGCFKNRIKTDFMAMGAIIDDKNCIWTDYSNQRPADGVAKISCRPDSIVNFAPAHLVPRHLEGFTVITLQPLHRLPDGQITYLAELEPTVYNLNDSKATVRYNLDFNGLWPSVEEINKIKGSNWAIKLRDMPMQRLGMQECNRWLIVYFYYNDDLYIHIYDKLNQTGLTLTDKDKAYCIPMAVTDGELFLYCNDDSFDVINLS